jgi:isopentenyldiphosphate isomerase
VEYFDVCDERGLPTGEVVERSTAHSKGILHRTTHVWIIRESEGGWQVLLQKRSENKDSYPGMYDTSSAGHIPAGTEPLDSALRELKEELGITAEKEQLKRIGTFRTEYEEVFHGKLFHDNEVISVYVYSEPVDPDQLVLQESEVEEVQYFDLRESYEEACKGSDRFCMNPNGMKVLIDYLGM